MSNEGDVKIWYVPQVPMDAFEMQVPDVQTGWIVLEAIYRVALFELEHNVKPDFANTGGIARYEQDGAGGFDWFDVEEEE